MRKRRERIHGRKVKQSVMWSKTYTNTLKIIIRSTTFWLLFIILMITAVSGAIGGFYVGDDEPGVVLSYNDYIQVITNSLISTLAFTALPLFCIVTTVLALNRDYGDDFFEIEKAAGIKYFKYLIGRLTAIISIAAIVTVISHSLCLHLYLFTRGGVPHLGQWHYFGDSLVRMLRIDLCVMLPSLIFYITLTYFLGTILKKGIYAAAASFTYLLSFYVPFTRFRYLLTNDAVNSYFDYFSPLPWKLRSFFHVYDTEWHETTIRMFDTSFSDAIAGLLFLIVFSCIFSLISYFRILRRTV